MNIAKRANVPTKKGRSHHSRAPHIAAKGHIAAAASTQPSQPSIIFSDEAFNCGYDVYLSHPVDGDNRGREFQDHAHALAFARVLRLEFGFTIVDRSGERS